MPADRDPQVQVNAIQEQLVDRVNKLEAFPAIMPSEYMTTGFATAVLNGHTSYIHTTEAWHNQIITTSTDHTSKV